MRRNRIALILAFSAAALAAQGFEASFGVEGGYQRLWSARFDPAGKNGNMYALPSLAAGIYGDFSYARLSLAYSGNVSRGEKRIWLGDASMEDSASLPDWKFDYLGITILAEIPLFKRPLLLSLGAGLRYSYCLFMDADGNGANERAGPAPHGAFDDWWLMGGPRIGFSAGGFVFGMSLLLGYDLSPTWDWNWPAGRYAAFCLEPGIWAGLRL
jgi:hypothetical protein